MVAARRAHSGRARQLATAHGTATMIGLWIDESKEDSSDPGVEPKVFQHSGYNSMCGSRRSQYL